MSTTHRPGAPAQPEDTVALATAVRAALAEITEIYTTTAKLIHSEPSLDAAFAAASELSAHLRHLAEVAADVRLTIVVRIWETGTLTISTLAARLGLSKTRAWQFIQKMTKQQEGPPAGP